MKVSLIEIYIFGYKKSSPARYISVDEVILYRKDERLGIFEEFGPLIYKYFHPFTSGQSIPKVQDITELSHESVGKFVAGGIEEVEKRYIEWFVNSL